MKECPICKQQLVEEDFTKTHSIFYTDGVLPICNDCITDYLKESDFSWRAVDKVCQWADIPFIVKEFERLRELNSDDKGWATGVLQRVLSTITGKSLSSMSRNLKLWSTGTTILSIKNCMVLTGASLMTRECCNRLGLPKLQRGAHCI